jgi:prolyl oligopeptidase
MTSRSARSLPFICAFAVVGAAVAAQFQYPRTRKVEQVDVYHGTKVPDPYRWLEDDNSAETAAWVEAQNRVTFPYLEKIPFRDALHTRVKKLNDYEKYTAPSRKGPYVFFRKNDGLQNQSVLYIQKGMQGEAEVLIDPNTWSEDGTVQLGTFVPSKDAKYAVYGMSRSGSDWQEYKVMELATKKTLDDTVEWVKVSGAAWHGDGFFYSRYPRRRKDKRRRPSTKATRCTSTRSARRSRPTSSSSRTRTIRSASTFSIRRRTNGSRSSTCRIAARGKMATLSS